LQGRTAWAKPEHALRKIENAGAAFAHPCMGLFVKNVCLSVYNCLTSSFWSSFFVRPQDRFFVPTMRWRE
jgi:hypothetical protein